MYPEANIPVVQMSLVHSLDPENPYSDWEALAPRCGIRVLIVGSGHVVSQYAGVFLKRSHGPKVAAQSLIIG